MKWLSDFFLWLFSCFMWGVLGGCAVVGWLLTNYGTDIPDYTQLKDYQPAVVTRVLTGDGQLMAEFATEKRVFVPLQNIPQRVREAFLSAEDRNFYHHNGLDYVGIGRAIFNNLKGAGEGRRMQGASTITQQVAKNFLLTNEVSFARKFKEAILAIRMERALSKDKLLELYLNQIYLGQGAYGVAAAATTYFGKALSDLSIEEVAYLGALPKAPNNYNPEHKKEAAIARRNWVIDRMLEDGYITEQEATEAKLKPLATVALQPTNKAVEGPYFAEEIRRFLQTKYGNKGLYEDGLTVRATMDPTLQTYATNALRNGLLKYERRHGYRGALLRWDDTENWQEKLKQLPAQEGMLDDWQLAVVLSPSGAMQLGLPDGTKIALPAKDIAWSSGQLKTGSVVMVSPQGDLDRYEQDDTASAKADDKKKKDGEDKDKDKKIVWRLRQVPKIQGALVAMDPRTGRVLAMQGGWNYAGSEFNRATQARRQVGSSFKPFVYLTALENGYKPNSKINDAPISFSMGAGQGMWSPQNYGHDFLGPTTLRVGVEKSRNLMTVRVSADVGMDKVAKTAEDFGIYDKMDTHLANCLGAQETTLIRMATAYAQLANGGKRVAPAFIDRIQNRQGVTIYARDDRKCTACGPVIPWTDGAAVPDVQDMRAQVADERNVYQIVSIMEGVVQRGTATALKSLGVPIAGKTGTTNDSRDVWFIGFTPNLLVGTYIGYDQPKSLGEKETGGRVSVPTAKMFLEDALKGRPTETFRIPAGVNLVLVNAKTGQPTSPDDPLAIYEPFLEEEGDDNTPAPPASVGGGADAPATDGEAAQTDNTEEGTISPDGVYIPPKRKHEDAGAADAGTPADETPPPAAPALQGTGGIY